MNKLQQKILLYSYDLLARRRYTIKEMIKKLDARNQKLPLPISESELAEIINKLINSNFLNDQDYALFYIDSQVRKKPQGIRALKHNLYLKGIDQEIIEQKINQAALDELQLAKQALERKHYQKISQLPAKEKAKVARFLATRGFPASIVYGLIKQD
ncbi:MAG: regulatory protein RecX [Candidatus Altimarinota bacterium]